MSLPPFECAACGRWCEAGNIACLGCGQLRGSGGPLSARGGLNADPDAGLPEFPPFHFVVKHFRGRFGLGRSFWVNGGLVPFSVGGFVFFITELLPDTTAQFAAIVILTVLVLDWIVWFWAIRGTWLSARYHNAAGFRFGRLAQVALLLSACVRFAVYGAAMPGYARNFELALGKQAGPPFSIAFSEDGSVLFKGGFNDGASKALARALDKAPLTEKIVLESPGGWTREGLAVAAIIRGKKLATHVEGECASACTLAFLAGTKRTLAPSGQLGFHSVRHAGAVHRVPQLERLSTLEVYAGFGLPNEFVERVAATAPESVWVPNQFDLKRAGILSKVTDWDDAREFLGEALRIEVEEGLGELHLNAKTLDSLTECVVTQTIEWLNQTSCSYHFNPGSVSKSVHLEEQERCVVAAGYEARISEVVLSCAKEKLPDDWRVLENFFVHSFAAKAFSNLDDSTAVVEASTCASHKFIEIASLSGCPLIEKNATSPENLFDLACVDRHLGNPEREIARIARACLPKRIRSTVDYVPVRSESLEAMNPYPSHISGTSNRPEGAAVGERRTISLGARAGDSYRSRGVARGPGIEGPLPTSGSRGAESVRVFRR